MQKTLQPAKAGRKLSRQSTAITPSPWTIMAYLSVPVIMFVFTVFVPLIIAVINSFNEWKGGPIKTFNGLANYIQLFQDGTFWGAFGHNIYLVIVCIIGQMGLAFVLVMFANSKLTHAKGVHRTFGFFPSTISAVCIGMIWTIILRQDGLLNVVLNNLGVLQGNWMKWPDYLGGKTTNAMLWVTIPLVWQYIGYYMVIMFSAIAGIDTEIFESSEIDGANGLQKAIFITMPLIKNTLLVCLTLCIAGNMKAFDNIYVMTRGQHNTMVMALYSWQISLQQNNLGYGSTLSVAIFVVSLAVIGGSQWLVKRLTRGVDA